MKHLALVIDDSSSAAPALEAARLVSRRWKAPSIMCVLPAGARPGGEVESGWPASLDDGLTELQWREVDAEARMGLDVDSAPEILALVARERPDLVVIGARERVPDGDARLEEWSAAVVQQSPSSVLVARQPPEAGYERIGVHVDPSRAGDGMLALARSLLAPEGVLDLLHVSPSGAPSNEEAIHVSRVALAARAGAAILVGEPKVRILAWQRRVEADLLVVGASGQDREATGITPLALAIAEAAPCDVLVTRVPNENGDSA